VNIEGPQWRLVIFPLAGSGRGAMGFGPAR
jgi:hypothetical protein